MESLTKTNILFHATLKIKQEILPSLSLKRDQFGCGLRITMTYSNAKFGWEASVVVEQSS